MPKEIKYSQEQLSAIDMFSDNRMSVLTGGPGVGKTTVVNEILKKSGPYTMLMAPTGKAAKRIRELTGHDATTIHKALEAKMLDTGDFQFTRNANNVLNCGTVIVDEVSMVDNDLMADLFCAIGDQTKVMLVGDVGQLESVGAGAVLRDILKSGAVPHVNLTKIFRNSGDIVKACNDIARGKKCKPSSKLDLSTGKNFRHFERKSASAIRETIETLVAEKLPAHDNGYDPVWDIQVMSPVNKSTLLSCDGLNELLQDRLNPNTKIRAHHKFKVGDKIINTKNQPMPTTSGEESYVVNGDVGRVLKQEDNQLLVEFFNPGRIFLFENGYPNLKLAYCVTCHKMQGSEAPVVVFPVHKDISYIVTRPWIYTAISRAKEICITVGPFEEIERAIQKHEPDKRKSFLVEKIQEKCIERSEI